jgi:putative inorganic carbon (HCO3(-)) transporter
VIDKLHIRSLYLYSILFIVASAICIVKEQYWFLALPIAASLVLLYIYALDKLMLFILFATPLAVEYKNPDFQIAFSMPTEPLMFGILLLFIIRLLYEGKIEKSILRHPVSIALLVSLAWTSITCLSSSMPLVSFKFLLARLWFVCTFYFLGIQLFKNIDNVKKLIWLSVIPMTAVIIYTVVLHSQHGFDEDSAHWVMWPFYADHTVYGALLALFIPVVIGLSTSIKTNPFAKVIAWIILFVFLVGLVFSYTRAAWVSLAAATGVYVLILLRIKFLTFLLSAVTLIVLFLTFQEQIFMKLEKNRQDSSNNLTEHVQSISNISSDASNLERVNRWSCAIRMFKERPVFGFGPGTYMFKYAPYQFSYEKTIISTNNGDNGNAHSEYIGPLAEQGILGLILVLVLFTTIIVTGLRVYNRVENREARVYALVFLLGLITYFVHGILNNFLDQDKAAVPFWAFVAAIVAIDLYQSKKSNKATTQ